MNDHVYVHFLERLNVIFGDPKTFNLPGFYAEYSDALSKCSAEALRAGVEELRRTHRFAGWPTVAQCLEAIEHAMPRPKFESPNWSAPIPVSATAASRNRVQSMVADLSSGVGRNVAVPAPRLRDTPKEPRALTEAERAARFNDYLRAGDARLYERDRAAIRAKMAGLSLQAAE